MAHKRPSKHLRTPRPLLAGTDTRRRIFAGCSHLVRDIRAGRSVKPYRCPGCDHLIQPGQAHVVVWPETPPLGMRSGIEARRHWHTHCWERA